MERLTFLLTYLLHGTESFLRSYPILSQARNFPHCMEPVGKLPRSQKPVICPILSQINPIHVPIPLPEDPS